MNPIERAIEIVGSQAALAEKAGVTPQAVNQWITKNRVPVERVLAIEAATVDETTGEPRVTRYDLRPDIYGERAAA
jgi:DNA-binding transcriptional regulator YdaS (Cro superfamily)